MSLSLFGEMKDEAFTRRIPRIYPRRGWTDEGVKELKNMKNLKSLFLGQRLTYKRPASPSDETFHDREIG